MIPMFSPRFMVKSPLFHRGNTTKKSKPGCMRPQRFQEQRAPQAPLRKHWKNYPADIEIYTRYIYIYTHSYIITISLLLYIYVHNIYDIFMYMQVYAFFFEDFIETTPSWIYEWYKRTQTQTHTHMHKLGFDGLQGLNPDLLLAVSGDPSLETTQQSPASNLSGAWRNTWLAIPQGVQRPST